MKKFPKRYWPLIGLVLLLAFISYYLIKSRHQIMEDLVFTAQVSDKGLKLENIHYIQNSPDEGVKWVLDAKEVEFSRDRTLMSFRHFRLKLNPENKTAIQLEGEGGEYDKKSGALHLRGDLQGHTDNGYRIFTDHILYSQKEGFLKTDKPVKIIGPFFSMAGEGLYLNLDGETLRIMSDVTTLINRESLAYETS